MTVTADARATLAALLAPVLAPWPVTATRPLDPALPCAWLDVAARRADVDADAPVVIVTFPVVILVDGADDAQVLALDDAGDRIWQAVVAEGADPVSATPDVVDVGGPRVRSLTTIVDVVVARPTLCAESTDLTTTGRTP